MKTGYIPWPATRPVLPLNNHDGTFREEGLLRAAASRDGLAGGMGASVGI
jgi:hypothetical protein